MPQLKINITTVIDVSPDVYAAIVAGADPVAQVGAMRTIEANLGRLPMFIGGVILEDAEAWPLPRPVTPMT